MYSVPTVVQPRSIRVGRYAVKAALSWGDAARERDAHRLDLASMRLLPRDHQVVRWVMLFHQLRTDQIRSLAFADTASRTSCDRVIQRLRDTGLLEPLVQPQSGGIRGGSAPTVYQLGLEGWRLFYTGKRRIQRVINYHALTIADVFISVKQAERAGWLDILEWRLEPDSWINVEGVDLRPDLYFVVGIREKGERLPIWVEVDLGGERQKQIHEKIDRYVHAYHKVKVDDPRFEKGVDENGNPKIIVPTVVFLAPMADRVNDLRQILGRAQNVPDGQIYVLNVNRFPAALRS